MKVFLECYHFYLIFFRNNPMDESYLGQQIPLSDSSCQSPSIEMFLMSQCDLTSHLPSHFMCSFAFGGGSKLLVDLRDDISKMHKYRRYARYLPRGRGVNSCIGSSGIMVYPIISSLFLITHGSINYLYESKSLHYAIKSSFGSR